MGGGRERCCETRREREKHLTKEGREAGRGDGGMERGREME